LKGIQRESERNPKGTLRESLRNQKGIQGHPKGILRESERNPKGIRKESKGIQRKSEGNQKGTLRESAKNQKGIRREPEGHRSGGKTYERPIPAPSSQYPKPGCWVLEGKAYQKHKFGGARARAGVGFYNKAILFIQCLAFPVLKQFS
jgi:hypothetical protein